MAEPIRLRPLTASELLDQAVDLYRRRFLVFVGIALVLTIPPLATALLSGSYRTFDIFATIFQPTSSSGAVPLAPAYNGALVGLSYVIGLVMSPLSGWSFSAVAPVLVAAAIDAAHGRDTGIGTALATTLKRYWALFGLMFIFLFGIFLFCLLIGVWFLGAWAVAVPVLLEERTGVGRALSRSWSLVQGHWWHVFGTLVATSLLGLAVEAALVGVAVGAAALVPDISNDTRSAIFLGASSLVGVFTRPLLPIACTLLYYDLRVRHEALDLDQLAATVSAKPALASS